MRMIKKNRSQQKHSSRCALQDILNILKNYLWMSIIFGMEADLHAAMLNVSSSTDALFQITSV